MRSVIVSGFFFAVLTAVPVLVGCSRGNKCIKDGAIVTVLGDHEHTASVPPEDVRKGAEGTYAVRGAHEHAFVLTGDNMDLLKHGEPVAARTSSVNAHMHQVTVRCKD